MVPPTDREGYGGESTTPTWGLPKKASEQGSGLHIHLTNSAALPVVSSSVRVVEYSKIVV